MQKYVAYYRVSTQKQGKSGLGLDSQREAVRQFLAGTDGYPPVAEFIEVESGRNTERTQLKSAVASCRIHRAILIIAKLDRLSRNAAFLMELLDSGIDVLFCDLPKIPADAVGRFLIQQMACTAELEAGLISERTKAALRAKVARDGQWDRNSRHHLVPGAGQAAAAAATAAAAAARAADILPVIQDIQAQGATSLRAIAETLNARGIPTTRGGTWSAPQVKRVLDRAAH